MPLSYWVLYTMVGFGIAAALLIGIVLVVGERVASILNAAEKDGYR